MGATVLVVSLGRLLADHVRLEPSEACAVLVRLWEHLAPSGHRDDVLPSIPSLDAVGITAFGDLEVRGQVAVAHPGRKPDEMARDLALVFRRLLASGRDTLAALPAQMLAVCRPSAEPHQTQVPTSPVVLLEALAPYTPPDPSDALAMLFARWMRATDSGAIRGATGRSDA